MRRTTRLLSVLALAGLMFAPACGKEEEEEPGGPAIVVTVAVPTGFPTSPTAPAIEPSAAFDGAKLYLVYAQDDGTGSHDVVFAEKPVDSSFSAPLVLAASAGLDSRRPHCALDSTGTLHVVWEEGTGTANREIYYATRTSLGVVTSQNLTVTPADDEAGPRVYVDKGDRVHIVWEKAGSIWYRRKTTSFSTPEQLPFTPTGTLASSPDLCGDSQDRIYVTWVEHVGVNQNLRILRANPGAAFGEVSSDGLAQRGGVVMSSPRLAGGGNGQVFLTFMAQDFSGDRGLFFCMTVDGGANFGVARLVAKAAAPALREPAIAVRSRPGESLFTVMLALNDGPVAGGAIRLYCSRDSGQNFTGGPHFLSASGTEAGANTAPVIALDADSVAAAWSGKPTGGGTTRVFTSISDYALPTGD